MGFQTSPVNMAEVAAAQQPKADLHDSHTSTPAPLEI